MKLLMKLTKTGLLVAFVASLLMTANIAHAIDHNYVAFDSLLAKHVKWNKKGVATGVNYEGFAADRDALKGVLDEFSAVTLADYNKFSRDQKLAFLINAYNAFTVELILTKYPDLESIKDLGSFFRNPWKKKFFTLLGDKRNLDWVEHTKIRAKGVFDEPRIHFVVNCASIGCPALRPNAMTADKLEKQLADSSRRFFSDKTRNRYDKNSGSLKVTKLFDWYAEDFEPVKKFLATYAKQLADDPADQEKIKAGTVDYTFLNYDWNLNKQY